MELIFVSGAGTMALLVALVSDYVREGDQGRTASADGVSRASATASSVVTVPSPDDGITYDRAA